MKGGRLRACGHGVVKLTLVRVVRIVERKRGGEMERFRAPVPYRVGPYDYPPAV